MTTDVLIVGGGPAGLALAVELGAWGVRCVVVERRTRPSRQPRAKLTNIRSMELMRRWGLADRIRAKAPLPAGFPSDVVFATRLSGWELVRFPNAISTVRDPDAPFAEPAQLVPQSVVEDVLRHRLQESGSVELRCGWQLMAFESDPAGVTAKLDGPAGPQRVRAAWMVGCDGSRSAVRRRLGVKMVGGADLARNLGVVFKAPRLWDELAMDRAVHFWLVNSDMPSIVGPLDARETWWLQATAIPAGVDIASLDPLEMVQRAIGSDVECQLLAVDPWNVNCQLAERYRVGRTFLAGDAAHLHPPMGGYGMNMGIGDGVDLGWKLAGVVQGWAPEALLDSYEHERRPVHRRVVDEAASNYAVLANDLATPAIEDDGPRGAAERRAAAERIRAEKAKEYRSTGVQLGYRYEASPIVEPDGTEPTPDAVSEYVPTARPGHRAPHVWLSDGRALHDELGPWFTLLRLGAAPAAPALQAAANAVGLPLRVSSTDDVAALEAYGTSLVLVRPDMHVAWRGDAEPANPAALIDRIRGAALAPAVDRSLIEEMC